MPRELSPGYIGKEEQASGRSWVCKAGNDPCSRKEPCRSCLGRRSRRSGLTKQRAAAKLAGVPSARFVGQNGNEENWVDPLLRWEIKSGAQCGPIATRFLAAEKQSETSKAIGDSRPFAFVAMPSGMTDGIVCIRLTAWKLLREALEGP